MADLLYNLIIFPLASIIEVFYLLFERVSRSPGLAVVGVSLAVNILALPLYAKAEKWQAVEREIQKRLKAKVDDIKAVFKGDERMMILSTYYRQNSYHPFYALRSSFGLLLQVPFFIAAYAFLAKQGDLQGRSFLFIKDLSAQDALLALGSLKLNLLPLLMTLANVVAAAVYTKGLALREKVQLYGMAALFLVLLYTSPAALTLYWTLNNLFSLAKNLVFRAQKPLRVLYLMMSAFSVGAVGYVYLFYDTTGRKRMVVAAFGALVLLAPLFVKAGKWFIKRYVEPAFAEAKDGLAVFFLSALSLTILVGLVLPTSLVASSAQEFSFVGGRASPLGFIWEAFTQSAGIFFFWPVVLYFLFGGKAKVAISTLVAIILPIALVNVFVFGGSYGTISRQFVFPDAGLLKPSSYVSAINLGSILAAAGIVALIIALKRIKLLKAMMIVCLLSLASMSGYKAFAIAGDFAAYKKIKSAETRAQSGAKLESVYRLSKGGKNVIVVMFDRAISGFIPGIMKEDPGLAEKYGGFTWYPNTASFGGHTLLGAPPLYGGYDYTPEEINKRSGDTLVSKHNEALSVMPRIFAEAGWESTISDASWANYSWIPDNNIFSKYPGVRAFNLEGVYTQRWLVEHRMETDPGKRIARNLPRFCLFKIAPMSLRFGLYDQGKWWDSGYENDDYAGYIDKYAPLDYLPELVSYEEKGNTFTLMVNNATHDSMALSYPGYEPSRQPTDSGGHADFGDELTWRIYQMDMAALKLFGRFLDSLRANGVYDNTQIIIVADHGSDLEHNPAFAGLGARGPLLSKYNPLLMVKDFGAKGELATDFAFGTNGDTPAIATKVLGAVKNPFTGKPLRKLAKGESVRIVNKAIYDPSTQGRFTMHFGPSDIITVRENIFEASNWSFP